MTRETKMSEIKYVVKFDNAQVVTVETDCRNEAIRLAKEYLKCWGIVAKGKPTAIQEGWY